jgi:hypothetical protein
VALLAASPSHYTDPVQAPFSGHLFTPAVIVYMINYVMSMSTQIFFDPGTSIINPKLAAASFSNTAIQVFAYGLMGRNS